MDEKFPMVAQEAGLERLSEPWGAVAIGFLVEKGRRTDSRGTTVVYGRILGRFLEMIGDPSAVGPLDVHRFAYGVGPRGIVPSASTIAGRLAAVSGFYDFAVRMELIATNPAAKVGRPKLVVPPPSGLSTAEVGRLFAIIPDTPSGLLDRAITITALLTGLRRSELMDLRVTDQRRGEPARYVVRTKGGIMRRRELPEPALLAIRTAHAADGTPALSSEARVFRISGATYYAHLRRYGETVGLGRISPHTLRHTAAKLRRQAGATIEQVSSFLGHQSIATTAHYLRRLEDERDDGWQAVAASLGLDGGTHRPLGQGDSTAAGSADRLQSIHEARQGDRGNGRPAIWTGGVHAAPLPQRDATHEGWRRRARRRSSRVRPSRSRRTRASSQLPALRG